MDAFGDTTPTPPRVKNGFKNGYIPNAGDDELDDFVQEQAAEAEQRRLAAEAEQRRLAAEAEQRRLAAEAEEQRRLAALLDKAPPVPTNTTNVLNFKANAVKDDHYMQGLFKGTYGDSVDGILERNMAKMKQTVPTVPTSNVSNDAPSLSGKARVYFEQNGITPVQLSNNDVVHYFNKFYPNVSLTTDPRFVNSNYKKDGFTWVYKPPKKGGRTQKKRVSRKNTKRKNSKRTNARRTKGKRKRTKAKR